MKIGFIDYYLDEWHANNYPQWFREVDPTVEVAYAYAMIDSPKGGMTTDEWCESNKVERCYSIDELVEKSDAITILSPDNCEFHEALCQIPLRSGKRVYIDKTFTPDADTARRIFALANQYHTPCYSSSALRFSQSYLELDRDQIEGIASVGGCGFEIYVIHQLEPIIMLMQAPVKRVMGLQKGEFYTLTLEFTDGRLATVNGYTNGLAYTLNVAFRNGENKVVAATEDFFSAFIRELVRFYKDGTLPVSQEETLRIMEARGAAVEAMKRPGEWINL